MNNDNMRGNGTADPGRLSRAAKVFVLIAAILGAFLVWVYAIGYDNTLFESTFSGVEITVTGEQELAELSGFTLAEGQTFSSITVTAKGKRSDLNALTSADFRAVVDVSSATRAGEQTFKINVYSPNGIEVVSQSSDTVMLFVDEFTQRTNMLTVNVDTGSSYVMSEGVTFVEATANPVSVLVSGPKSKLDEIEGAYVVFNLDGVVIDDSIYGYGSIELRDSNGKTVDNPYITLSETTAYVSINVTKQKTVPVRVEFTGGVFSAEDVTIELSSPSVTVSGSSSVLDAFDEIVVYIDETLIDGSKTFDYSIVSLLPEGVVNESGISKLTAKVTLPSMSVRTYTVGVGAITVINLPENAEYKILNSIDVTLMGARSAFDTVDKSSITATVDYSRVTVNEDGSFTAVPVIDLGGATGVYVFDQPGKVTFTVTLPQED